jgi:hypothetical protein
MRMLLNHDWALAGMADSTVHVDSPGGLGRRYAVHEDRAGWRRGSIPT